MSAAKIKVKKISGREFAVEVEEEGSKTFHQVTLDPTFTAELALDPQQVVERSFEYLLAREPKEAILSSFSIPETISRYFPNFEKEIAEK